MPDGAQVVEGEEDLTSVEDMHLSRTLKEKRKDKGSSTVRVGHIIVTLHEIGLVYVTELPSVVCVVQCSSFACPRVTPWQTRVTRS